MRIRRVFMIGLSLVLTLSCLAACGKKDDGIAGKFDDLKDVQAELSGNSADSVEMPEDTKLGLSEDVSVPEDSIAKMYPGRDKDAYFMRFAEEAPEQVFMAYDEDEYEKLEEFLGHPYYIEGIVRKVYDSFDGFDAFADMDAASVPEGTAYQVDVDGIRIMVYDFLPAYVKVAKESAGKDMDALASYKAMYDKLKLYEDHPAEGEFVRIYGFYMGFDEPFQMPAFTYGLSKLVFHSRFGSIYPDYLTDETVQEKYLNYVDFEKPVFWSEMRESSSTHYYYFDTGTLYWDYYDNDDNEPLISFIGPLFVGADEQMMNEWNEQMMMSLGDLEYGPWNSETYGGVSIPNIDILEAGLTTIGDGSIEAFRVRYMYVPDEGTQGTGYYAEVVAFEHKHKFILLSYYDSATEGAEAEYNEACFDHLVDSIKLRAN